MSKWQYISEPNHKLGNVPTFDIPAASKYCPGATKACKNVCYARQIALTYPKAGLKYRRNYRFAHSREFIPYMIRNVRQYETFRIHGNSGDFFSADYVNNWVVIARNCPKTRFYFYTRSWRLPVIWRALKAFAALPNVTMNLSLDAETGIPIEEGSENFKWCYLSIDDKDVMPGLRKSDLVFRHQHKIDMRWRGRTSRRNIRVIHNLGGVRTCPLERSTSLPAENGLTCSNCRICV